MQLVFRRPASVRSRGVLALLALICALPWQQARAAEKPRLRVDDYQIDAELVPSKHQLVGRAEVKFTALEGLSVAVFELHNDLRPTRVLDAAGKTLSAERVTQDSTVRVALPAGLSKDASTTLTFEYAGTLENADNGPVSGLKLAYVGDETSYLLYAGRWFPVSNYGINRFTATMHITVPAHWVVIGSGAESAGSGAPPAVRGRAAQRSQSGPQKTYTFTWNKQSFPGTIIAGQFLETTNKSGGLNVSVYFKPTHKEQSSEDADTAAREFEYFSGQYGPPLSTNLKVVELPDDTVPAAWAPEVAALASRAITGKVNYRLLANTISRQWWGASVSPVTRDDWWLSDGFARYSEARYVESAAGSAGYQEAIKDIEVGALAYDTVPLASIGKMDPFSPEFQSLATDKGAEILHMLRWVIGDSAFENTMRVFAVKNAGKPARVSDFQKEAEGHAGQQLTWFFSQWLNSTGAPEFKNKYTVFRIGQEKEAPVKTAAAKSERKPGFRIVGQINQDLDLFRMPVDLKVDTDGQTEEKRIDVVGTDSPYTIETYGRPRRIVIDPNDHVLKNSPDVKVRTAILRGQQLVQTGDLAEALKQFQQALENNRNSSLAHYRIAEVFFLQHNYQAAANEYREAENGDLDPKWTEVWSYIQLGKIFDLTGQRERALGEYRKALQTNDNTKGALGEARKYMSAPYQQKSGDQPGL